jgi:hypothetical protein
MNVPFACNMGNMQIRNHSDMHYYEGVLLRKSCERSRNTPLLIVDTCLSSRKFQGGVLSVEQCDALL